MSNFVELRKAEVRRICLLGTRALLTKRVSVSPDKLPIILLGSLDDALRGGTPYAEGRNEGW